jgi:hypothetical protein|tara:strand:- start:1965 stop:2849 length:885 start_codon:yes stop_codon:yes gene_type:complete
MMKALNHDYYGEEFHWFLGKVTSDSDPEHLGRVQIRVYGVHSQDRTLLPDHHLPWAQCLIPSTEGGISGIGHHAKILPGALVFGFFMDGKSSQVPFVLGSIHHKEYGVMNQSEVENLEQRPNEFDPRTPLFESNPVGSNIDDNLVGDSNAEKIFNFFTCNGFTAYQAAGFVGNFYAESSLDPKKVNPNDKGEKSEGLAQWRADRRERLISYSKEYNLPYDSLTAQLNYVLHELDSTENNALGEIKSSGTVKDAATAICRFYERPEFRIVKGVYTSSSLDTRVNSAIDTYRRFAR